MRCSEVPQRLQIISSGALFAGTVAALESFFIALLPVWPLRGRLAWCWTSKVRIVSGCFSLHRRISVGRNNAGPSSFASPLSETFSLLSPAPDDGGPPPCAAAMLALGIRCGRSDPVHENGCPARFGVPANRPILTEHLQRTSVTTVMGTGRLAGQIDKQFLRMARYSRGV